MKKHCKIYPMDYCTCSNPIILPKHIHITPICNKKKNDNKNNKNNKNNDTS